MRSVLAPKRQALSRASWNKTLSIFASRHLIPCACASTRLSNASMCLVCSPISASICAAASASSAGLRALRSLVLIERTSSMCRLLCRDVAENKAGDITIDLTELLRASFYQLRVPSHASDSLHLLQALPGQAQNKRVELVLAQRHGRDLIGVSAWPLEAPAVEPSRRTPDAEAIVHQELDARRTHVGKEVTVVRLRSAEDPHHAGQQPLGAGAHVDGLDRQPHRIDTDHRSQS